MKMGKEIIIDAINPRGNKSLILEQIEKAVKDYLTYGDQRILAGHFKGAPSEIKEYDNKNIQGNLYKLKFSLEEF
jgi:hypothetical protein